jgi:hypothetical protein
MEQGRGVFWTQLARFHTSLDSISAAPLFSDIQKGAKDSLLILVNASRCSCDTLVIFCTRDPVHIALEISQTRAQNGPPLFNPLQVVLAHLIIKWDSTRPLASYAGSGKLHS